MTKCQRELLLDQAESYRNEMEKKHKEMSKFDFNSTGERSELSSDLSDGSNQSSPDCKPFILIYVSSIWCFQFFVPTYAFSGMQNKGNLYYLYLKFHIFWPQMTPNLKFDHIFTRMKLKNRLDFSNQWKKFNWHFNKRRCTVVTKLWTEKIWIWFETRHHQEKLTNVNCGKKFQMNLQILSRYFPYFYAVLYAGSSLGYFSYAKK